MTDPASVVDAAQPVAEIMKLGFAGAIIIAEAVVIGVLYRAKEKQNEDRLADTKAILDKTTTAFVKGSESMDASTEQLKGVQGALTNLVAVLDARNRR